MKILVTPTSLQPGKNDKMLNLLKDFSKDLIFNPYGRPLTEEELIPLLKECDGYLAGLDQISEKVLEECHSLKVISRYGAGVDRVDIDAAQKRSIVVTNTPGMNAEAVGELAFALILSLARRIPYLNTQTKSGQWVRTLGTELRGKTLGILGLGAIGKVVAGCGLGFGMRVIAHDQFNDKDYCDSYGIEIKKFGEVIKESDVISIHLPLTSKTKHIIGKDAFSMMKEGVIVVNTSRGGIIDEGEAYKALKSGKLAGLGLDAFEMEPPGKSKLFEFDQVIATPHTGAHTKEAIDKMALLSIKNLMDVLSGEKSPYVVNQ